jgi:hypothetical protein
MEVKKAVAEINKLRTLSEKLKYYNSNFWPPIQVGFYYEPLGLIIDDEQHKLFCLCDQCKDKGPISDFDTYRDLRNQETQRIADFFESKLDYEPMVDYYFKIGQDCGTTSFSLTFVPDKLEEMDSKVLPYKNIYTIDITPKNNTELSILKNHLKKRLLNGKYSFFMAQFTFEKRVEDLGKLLKINRVKDNRDDLYYEGLDKIRKSKVNRDSKKQKDITLFKILAIADDIIKDNHTESYNDFSKIEMTILAEDNNKYKEHLTRLLEGKNKPLVNDKEYSNIQQDDKYLNEIWFKVGVLIAKGDLNEYYKSNKIGFKEGYSALKVAKELNNIKYEKFILATINNYPSGNSNADKNIYNSKKKMNKIIKYCNENHITIDNYFLTRIPVE